MRLVLVGTGYIARVHLSAARAVPGAEVTAIVGRTLPKTQALAKEFGIPQVFTDWRKAFAARCADAAIICLPHALHRACALDALQAGLAVLIEKPLAISSREVEEIVALADLKSLTLMVAHMKRFDRRFIVMKEMVDAGRIGTIFLAKSEWIGPREIFAAIPWVADPHGGGGPLMGFGSHHIDLLHWLVGPVTRVTAVVNHRAVPNITVEDSAVATLEFGNGAIGSLIYTWGAEIEGQFESLVLYGTKGTLKLEGEHLWHISQETYGDRQPRAVDVTRTHATEIGTFGKELALSSLEPFILQLRHFIECVTKKTEPCIDGRTAGEAVAVIARAYQVAGVEYSENGPTDGPESG